MRLLRSIRPPRGLPLPSGWLVVVMATVGLVLAGGEACGCPNCKDAVNTTDPDGLNLARGYFYSILLMLAMPFTLAGSFGCYVWREMRRQQREQGRLGGGLPDGGATLPLRRPGSVPEASVESHP